MLDSVAMLGIVFTPQFEGAEAESPSSRGLGQRIFTSPTGVRIPVATLVRLLEIVTAREYFSKASCTAVVIHVFFFDSQCA